MTVLLGVCAFVVAAIACVELIRYAVERLDSEDVAGGTIVARPGHRCRPPSAFEWAGGELAVDQPLRYPEGTTWLCSCGLAWVSTYGRGLWLRWERSYAHDAPLALEEGEQ